MSTYIGLSSKTNPNWNIASAGRDDLLFLLHEYLFPLLYPLCGEAPDILYTLFS